VFKDDGPHPFEMHLALHPFVRHGLYALEEQVKLTGKRFVIGPILFHRLLVRLHFADEIAQGGAGLRPMLAILVPIARQKGEENADRNQDHLDHETGKSLSMFMPGSAHMRMVAKR
jgi:hypothetical protein